MVPRVSRFHVMVSSVVLGAVACSGSGAQLRGSVVTSGTVSYDLGPVAPSWEPLQVEGNDLAWHDAATEGTVHVNHTCDRSMDTPLTALVQHLLIGFGAREVVLEETVPFDHREARHVVVRASLDGVPRQMELYVLKKDGCVFDLGLVAPPEHFEASRAAFAAFAGGFHTARTPLDR